MKRILTIIGFATIFTTVVNAQQLNSLALNSLNRYALNPAAAGTKAYTFVSTSYSKYWSGINGSPEMQVLSGHSLISQKSAVGINLVNENTGLSGKTGAEFTYAYHLPISSNGTKLSFGLSGVVTQHKLFKDKFIIDDVDDDAIKNAQSSVVLPDANFGISLYKENKFYIDIAVRQLLGRQVTFINAENLENIQVRHFSFGAGYTFNVNDNIQIEPSVLAKATQKFEYQIDAGLKAVMKKTLAIGCFYRTGENSAILPFIGFDSKNVMFAYSYGIISGDIASHSTGSHEIMLVLKLNSAKSNLE
jgi:type IX secretion system PorP/SprF family membrane protein